MFKSGFDTGRLNRLTSHLAGYVDRRQLSGWQIRVSQCDDVVAQVNYGLRDIDAQRQITDDTVFRIYSMTKPITSLGVMMLYEDGEIDIEDPICRYIPSFTNMSVLVGGTARAPVVRPASSLIKVSHLLNHTSGMTYGSHHVHVQDEIYRNAGFAGFEQMAPRGYTLEQCVDSWAKLPLRFDPGTGWNYSVATDVLGRLIEVVSGKTLDRFMKDRIFDPLGMVDTDFRARPDMDDRLAVMYVPRSDGSITANDRFEDRSHSDRSILSGGGGLLSTLRDYCRFISMLTHHGQLGGAQLVGPRVIDMMTRNSLPGGKDIASVGIPLGSRMSGKGIGFGFGFSVLNDPVAALSMGSPGEYGWGGVAGPRFWVDPLARVSIVFMTQLLPIATYNIWSEIHRLVYSAMLDPARRCYSVPAREF